MVQVAPSQGSACVRCLCGALSVVCLCVCVVKCVKCMCRCQLINSAPIFFFFRQPLVLDVSVP